MMEYGMSIIRKESGMGIVGVSSDWSPLTLPAKLLHLSQSGHFDVQTDEIVVLWLDLASMVNIRHIVIEQIGGEVRAGAGRSGDEGALGLCLHQCHWVTLNVLGVVFATMGMHIV